MHKSLASSSSTTHEHQWDEYLKLGKLFNKLSWEKV
jgi:hypothetical protein